MTFAECSASGFAHGLHKPVWFATDAFGQGGNNSLRQRSSREGRWRRRFPLAVRVERRTERMRGAMTRQLRSTLVLLLIAITVSAGCHPTQPFYFHEDGDLNLYLDQATRLDNSDVFQPLLEDVESTEAPLTISDPEFQEVWDLELEEAL